MTYKAIHTRFGIYGQEEFDTFQEAESYLESAEDMGLIFAICIVRPDGSFWIRHPDFINDEDVKYALNMLSIKNATTLH